MNDRLAASTNSYHTYSLEDALAGIAGAGFKSVELASVPGWTEHVRRDADDEAIGYIKDLLRQHGLTAISLSGHSDLVSDAGVVEFRKALNVASKLGIGYVSTSTGGHDASSAGSLDEQRERFLARIGPLADEAAALGITICLETHGGLLATGASSADLVRRIGKPNVGINYDPGNVIFYGDTRPEGDVAAAAPLVKHLHVKDQIGGARNWHFPAAGTGEVDFKAIFAALDAVGFNGPCSVEVEFQGEPWPSLDDVNAAMAQSYQFVRPFVRG
ncbi:MAG: L-ribulose-5-phosphate 3-epimerase [Thermomicrobiales bacterium]|jgi:sugar phosphate isomerase/epimerase|nr:L-ribulose-5-phosphate 3-epimerase [Thermomicrobiales bacterium]MEA2583681.1 L-ribulose-5-phosphate 3-epimerase [Thermomicrobiales bacterium]